MRSTCCFRFGTDSGGQYLLDSATGAVIPTNAILDEAIELCACKSILEVERELKEHHPADQVDGILDFVQRWASQFGGLYQHSAPKPAVDDFDEEDVKQLLMAGNTFQLVLNLTEACNYRCAYCYFSEVYQYTRNPTSAALTLETGIKALDLFFDMLADIAQQIPGKRAGIASYGGEPLLQFEMMKALIDYALDHAPVPISFNLTTNGYLLTDDIGDYLVDRQVNIAVSLDGSKENHDRNRLLPTGKGTHDVVMRNIKRFQERHPDYWRIGIVTVYDTGTDLEANVRFFEEHKLRIIFLTSISQHNTNYYDRFTEADRQRFAWQRDKLLRQYLELKKAGKPVPEFTKAFFEFQLSTVVLRSKGEDARNPMIPFTSTCIPGSKLSVRVDGTLDICERVSGTMPIGHVDTGIDYARAVKIIRQYNAQVTRDCQACPLNRTCPLCFAQCDNNKDFALPKAWCEKHHDSFGNACAITYSVLEQQPLAFKELELRHPLDILFYA